ncbi:MAG: hypothetical protein LRY55_06615 [Leadbetterella sp.]|nr:hypothetical protein [Leadbetterella sp.]
MEVSDQNVLAPAGVFSAVSTRDTSWTSWGQPQQIRVSARSHQAVLQGIALGDVREDWRFTLEGNKLLWTIRRTYPRDLTLEDMALPAWHFRDLRTWKGGILDNGGMVWCKYLSSVNDTYGVHTGGVIFWNEDREDALKIAVHTDYPVAAKYSHHPQGAFTLTHLMSEKELKPRHHLNRFVHGKADVFAPFEVKKGTVEMTFELAYVNYLQTYDRGTLPGIDATAVRELLNTTGRYGVVDNGM